MIWGFLVALGSSWAGESDMLTPEERQAEYVRLSEEMLRAAKSNRWVRVERLFAKLDVMGQPHTRRNLRWAAQSASALGDIRSARERLLAAVKIEEDQELMDWLWRIQDEYGPVFLAADLPANYRLEAAQMPFSPEKRKAVEFAQQQVVDESYFDGLLPRGDYVFKPYEEELASRMFAFTLRADKQRFDLRTRDEPTRRDRRKRARIDKRIARKAPTP